MHKWKTEKYKSSTIGVLSSPFRPVRYPHMTTHFVLLPSSLSAF